MSLPTALTGNVGDQIVVKSATTDANGLPSASSVVWSSDTPSVAIVQNTVDLPGGALITCLAAGSAIITAQAGAVTATFNLTVVSQTPGPATSIDVEVDKSFQPIKKMQ